MEDIYNTAVSCFAKEWFHERKHMIFPS